MTRPFEVTPLIDGRMRLHPGVLYPGTSEPDWKRHPGLRDEGGMIPIPYGGFLVRAPGRRVVLVDIGGGPQFTVPAEAGELPEAGQLLDRLAAAGVSPEDVTDVVFSHLHPDHVGWASRDGEPTFPRAAHLCHRDDLEHFLPTTGDVPHQGVASVLAPVADRISTWEGSEGRLHGIRLLHMPGHTPGSTVVVVPQHGRNLAIVGDIVHCPAEFGESWQGGVDVDPGRARATRLHLTQRFTEDGTAVTGPHFPRMSAGALHRDGDRARWSELTPRRS